MSAVQYLIPPVLIQLWEERAKAYGPVVSGALFGAGWWFWVDAVVAAEPHHKPLPQYYIPGVIATIALIMINIVRRDDLQEYDPFDDGGFCRSRFWLFLSYFVALGAIVGAVGMLLQLVSGTAVWTGVAGLVQVTLIIASGLLFFVSRNTSETDYGGYSGF